MARSALSNGVPDSRPWREKCLDVGADSPGSLQATGARQCALNHSEEELLACLDEGLLYKEIEERLHLSHTALRKRQHRLYVKLAAQNRTEALNHWREIRHGGGARRERSTRMRLQQHNPRQGCETVRSPWRKCKSKPLEYRMISPRNILVGTANLLLSVLAAGAQGTFTVTFDGPPAQPPGTQYGMNYYHESGVWFLPIPGTDGFTRNGGGILGYPDNGTAYLQGTLGDSLRFGLDDGSSFDPVSVDLAEYSDIVRDPETVHFVGYRQDGTVLTDDITTAGIFNGVAPVFQTFSFSPQFSGLVRVEVTTFPSLDNLTLRRSVPEPEPGSLRGIGAILLLGIRRQRGAIRLEAVGWRLEARVFHPLRQRMPALTAAGNKRDQCAKHVRSTRGGWKCPPLRPQGTLDYAHFSAPACWHW